MSPTMRDLQLTQVPVGRTSPSSAAVPGDDSVDMEEGTRLLDSYDNGDDNSGSIEDGMRRIQVCVTGMTCAACSNSVEGALKSIDGVFRASVALLQNRADVVFDPILVKVSSLLFSFLLNQGCCVC